MPTNWGLALQVGGVGFGLVFVILIVLYIVLSFTGWLSKRLNPAKSKTAVKTDTPAQP